MVPAWRPGQGGVVRRLRPPGPHWPPSPRSSGSWMSSPQPPPCAASMTCEWPHWVPGNCSPYSHCGARWGRWGLEILFSREGPSCLAFPVPRSGGVVLSGEILPAKGGGKGGQQEWEGLCGVRAWLGAVCQLLCLLLSFNTTRTPLPVLTGLAPAPRAFPGAQLWVRPLRLLLA